nr:hypothetical protein [Candidatus Sigynarchaeota archaeon]
MAIKYHDHDAFKEKAQMNSFCINRVRDTLGNLIKIFPFKFFGHFCERFLRTEKNEVDYFANGALVPVTVHRETLDQIDSYHFGFGPWSESPLRPDPLTWHFLLKLGKIIIARVVGKKGSRTQRPIERFHFLHWNA